MEAKKKKGDSKSKSDVTKFPLVKNAYDSSSIPTTSHSKNKHAGGSFYAPPPEWMDQRVNEAVAADDEEMAGATGHATQTKPQWENDIARHIVSIYATTKAGVNLHDSEAILEYVDKKKEETVKTVSIYLNEVDEKEFVNYALERKPDSSTISAVSAHQMELQKSLHCDREKAPSSSQGRTHYRREMRETTVGGETDEKFGEEATENKDFTDLQATVHESGKLVQKKMKKKLKKKKKLAVLEPKQAGLSDVIAGNGEIRAEDGDLQELAAIVKAASTGPGAQFRTSHVIKDANGEDVVIRGAPRCVPIWFVSTGDVYSDWRGLLPGASGEKLQANLNALYEQRRFKEYVVLIEGLLDDMWRTYAIAHGDLTGILPPTREVASVATVPRSETQAPTFYQTSPQKRGQSASVSRSPSPTRDFPSVSRSASTDSFIPVDAALTAAVDSETASGGLLKPASSAMKTASRRERTAKAVSWGDDNLADFGPPNPATLVPPSVTSAATATASTAAISLDAVAEQNLLPEGCGRASSSDNPTRSFTATAAASAASSVSRQSTSVLTASSSRAGGGGVGKERMDDRSLRGSRDQVSSISRGDTRDKDRATILERGDSPDRQSRQGGTQGGSQGGGQGQSLGGSQPKTKRRAQIDFFSTVREHCAAELARFAFDDLFGYWEKLILTANAMGIILVEKKMYPDALEVLTKAEGWAKKDDLLPKDMRQELLSHVHDTLAYYYFARTRSLAAMSHCQLAYKIHKKMSNPDLVGADLLHISAVNCQLGNFKEAHKFIYIFLELVENGALGLETATPKQLCLVAVAYHNLAVVQLKLQVPDLACKSSQNARKIARLCLSVSNRWLPIFQRTHEMALEDCKFQLSKRKDLSSTQLGMIKGLAEMLFDPSPPT